MRRALLYILAVGAAFAQDFTHRGFLDTTILTYPQAAPGDSGRVVGEGLLRYEAFYKLSPAWRLSGGVDARADTHRQVKREFHFSTQDRDRERPALALRRLSATYVRGRLSLEMGKQFIRWGKADILNPTDRFAPRDFLNVVTNDFLPVTAARLTYGGQSDSVDVVWSPRFTPSRLPLVNQRWAVLPPGVTVESLEPRYPGGSQFGLRWNHIGRASEFSLSMYDGNNHLPLIDATVARLAPPLVRAQPFYAAMRMYGGDAAVPLPLVTLKGEAAYFTSSTPQADEYVLYVIQVERQSGEWFLVGGYAGEAITQARSQLGFAYDRGFSRAFLGRAGYTIDANRSLAFDTAIRQNGKGVWARAEYSQAFRQHWRATLGFTWIRGDPADFLGQYRRNSHALLALRYSF